MKIRRTVFFETNNVQHQILVSNSNCYVNIASSNRESYTFLVDSAASVLVWKHKHVVEQSISIHKENVITNGLGDKIQS